MSELDATLAAIDALKARGVKRYKDSNIEVELFEPRAIVEGDDKPSETSDKCRCGHYLHEHNEGLCIAQGGGCDPVKCAPPEKG